MSKKKYQLRPIYRRWQMDEEMGRTFRVCVEENGKKVWKYPSELPPSEDIDLDNLKFDKDGYLILR